MSAEHSPISDWLHLVQAEYLEMPGLQLTRLQVQRLCGLDDQICRQILEQLVEMHFLRRTDRELYILDVPAC